MAMTKIFDGKIIPLTDVEISLRNEEIQEWEKGEYNRSMVKLRSLRTALLASSDWTGLVDVDMTNEKLAEWKLYRQHLRNLPEGLDTETKVKEVTWPTKPA